MISDGDTTIRISRKNAARIAAWAILVVLVFLWILFIKRTVSVGRSQFRFVTKDRWLTVDEIARERGEDNRLAFQACLRDGSGQLIGLSFDEVLVTSSVEGGSEQLFRGYGTSRWPARLGKRDLHREDCMPLFFGFPENLRASGKEIEFVLHVKYALAAQKGETEFLTVDRARTAEGTLRVNDKVLVDLLSHRFLWESIFGKRSEELSSAGG